MFPMPYPTHYIIPAPTGLLTNTFDWSSFVSKELLLKIKLLLRIPRQMVWAFVMESVETKQMLYTFVRHGRQRLAFRSIECRQPTPEEMQQAVDQLKDIPRLLPFFVLIVMPLPGVTEGYMLVALTLEKWMGERVSLLPSQFRKVFDSVKGKH